MIRRLAVLLAVVGVLVAPLPAEVLGNNAISVTDVSQTVTFSRVTSSVSLCSASTSSKKYFARLFTDADTPAAATTSSPIYLDPGQCVSISHNPRTEGGSGYSAASFVCAAGETATARLLDK